MSVSPPGESPASRHSTPVDGVEVLGALSPSRAGDFLQCPLQYRFRTIDRLPEPTSPDAVRGTLVHKVLEDLFDLPAPDRTPERARDLLVPSWDALLNEAPELAELFGEEGADVAGWLTSCREVIDRYFTLEDPRRLEPAERELYVETLLDSKLLLRGFVDRVDVSPEGLVRVVDYKGLARDTPLPTPTGWTTMGDVSVGDQVLGSDGRATKVILKSGTHDRPCYRVAFRDGTAVVCDNVHLWTVTTSARQRQTTSTVDTEALAELLGQQRAHGRAQSVWVETAQALQLPEVSSLPIAPWLLGAWLGDGEVRSGMLTVGRQDADDMIMLIKQHWPLELRVTEETTAHRMCPTGLPEQLWAAGLIHSKHIPPAYLRAGTEQRIELLRGLMDTGGWWKGVRRRAGFTTTDDRLARDVLELLRTLGIAPMHFEKPYTNPVRPDRTWHVIEFTPTGFNPFSLPRKATACDSGVSGLQRQLARRRIITSVEPVEPVPTQCIAVEASDQLYLCGEGFIPTHNTGRSPGLGFEAKALFQMKFYALVLWRLRGVVPAMLQLVYLGNGEILRYAPDEQDLLATERKVEAIWRAIQTAQQTGDWRPRRSRLCDWCAHRALCPEFGGTPPPLPVDGDAAERAAGDLDTDEGVAPAL